MNKYKPKLEQYDIIHYSIIHYDINFCDGIEIKINFYSKKKDYYNFL